MTPSFEARDAIVVIKLGALGDVVRTSYVVNALAETTHRPIVWVTRRDAVDLLRLNPHIARVVALESDSLPSVASLVFSLDDELEAVRVAGAIAAPRLVGAFVDAAGSIAYTDDASPWFDMGLVSRFGKDAADELKKANRRSHAEIFSEMLGVSGVSPAFYGDVAEQATWRARRGHAAFLAGLNLFAGSRWPAKELPAAESLQLLARIDEHLSHAYANHRLAVFADRSNGERALELQRQFTPLEVWDTSRSVLSFAAAVAACDAVVSTDSLGLHLAIAQDIPSVSYYAPTSAVEIDVFGRGVKVASTSPDYCNYRSDADNRTLTADRLFAAWLECLAKSGKLHGA